ncbi:DinB family protein [Geodermatophilus sp. SYSU D00815]
MTPSRSRPPAVADERTQLLGWLGLQRAIVHYKCEGLADDDAHRALLPTSPLTTVAGVVAHLRWTEHCWFDVIFAGGPEDANPQFGDVADADWQVAGIPLAELLGEYERQCARSDEIVAGASFDDVAAHGRYGGETLRWILHHMLEETGRHVGHLDLLREQLDGTKGYW